MVVADLDSLEWRLEVKHHAARMEALRRWESARREVIWAMRAHLRRLELDDMPTIRMFRTG